MTDDDRQLDDLLRQLPLPDGLRSRGRLERLFDDDAVDRLVGRVAVPTGLADRVRASLAAAGGRMTGVVDLSRFSAGPAELEPVQPQRGIWRQVRRLRAAAREAAAVAGALGLVLLLAVAGIEVSRRLEGFPAPRDIPAENATAYSGGAAAAGRVAAGQPVGQRSTGRPAASPTPGLPAGTVGGPPRAFPDRPDRGAAERADRIAATGPGLEASGERAAAPPPTPPVVRGAAVTAPEWRQAPTMGTVPIPDASRRAVPRSPAFDFAFEMAHGEAPFIDPAADPALAIDRPPLTLGTDGFDTLLDRGLGRGGRGGQTIRVEEILAAMPPPPAVTTAAAGPVQLGFHAVPSGRTVGGRPTLLLEAAIHAPGRREPEAEPRSVTMIIDQSAAGDPQVWPRCCRGLAAVATQLEPAARVSVVLCGSRPRVAVRDATPAEVVAAARRWERLPPATTADLDAGLELARSEGLASGRTIVVSNAVTLERGRTAVAEALAEWHRAVAAAGGDRLACTPTADGPRFVIIDPAAGRSGSEPTFGRTGADAVAIRRELLRQVTGRPSLVAGHCRLEVQFDPARVERYRLIGHRQSTIASLSADPTPATDLHAGETTRAVYEVVPRQGDATGLARLSLSWRSPDGVPQHLTVSDLGRDDRRAEVLSAHGRTLLLAVWLGELAGGSAHLQSDRRPLLARLESLARDWRSSGELPPFAAALTGLLDRRPGEQRPPR
jgi:hypothetical protein